MSNLDAQTTILSHPAMDGVRHLIGQHWRVYYLAAIRQNMRKEYERVDYANTRIDEWLEANDIYALAIRALQEGMGLGIVNTLLGEYVEERFYALYEQGNPYGEEDE